MMKRNHGLKMVGVALTAVMLTSLSVTAVIQAQAANTAILKVVLRDFNSAKAVSGVTLEILTYSWGVPVGQPYSVAARGETDVNGSVSFDVSSWPRNGYRFRFLITDHTSPPVKFMRPEDNQFRGFPGEIVEGSNALQIGMEVQTLWFVLTPNGLVENDLSDGQGKPAYKSISGERGYGTNPYATPVDGKSYVATAVAQTATARSLGTPDPTLPAPPPPRDPNSVFVPLSITPEAEQSASGQAGNAGGAAAKPVTTAPVSKGQGNSADGASSTTKPTAKAREIGPAERIAQILPLVLLIVLIVVAVRFRHQVYRLAGIYSMPKPGKVRPRRKRNSAVTTTTARLVRPTRRVELDDEED